MNKLDGQCYAVKKILIKKVSKDDCVKVSHQCFGNRPLWAQVQRCNMCFFTFSSLIYTYITNDIFLFVVGPQGSQSVVQPAACKCCGLSHCMDGTCSTCSMWVFKCLHGTCFLQLISYYSKTVSDNTLLLTWTLYYSLPGLCVNCLCCRSWVCPTCTGVTWATRQVRSV